MNDSIATFFNWVKNNKYWFVTIAFLLIIIFFDENNMIKHFQNQREIAVLKSEIDELKEELEVLSHKSAELHKDIEIMEKVAREKYGMPKEGEEVFIVED
ncbi:MAG: septum formation initiator family protein [Bacteroidaceae bacterium]|nr:septum formation initiator family protein [Bacteroidaceae bacterium]